MKRATPFVLAVALGVLCAQAAFAANSVRISQVYGGGGNSGATYQNDYVELFNASGAPVNISGWSLQYGSATGTVQLGACVNCLTVLPVGSVIPSCGYFLIQLAAGAGSAPALPVTPDYAAPQATANNLSATAGKIALKADGLTTNCSPQSAFVDLVGYGTAVNCFEGAAAAGLTNSSMAVRHNGGLDDTDNNAADFTATAGAVPRNSQSPPNTGCLATPTTPKTWGRLKMLYK
jgi:hypothetical protein